MSETPQADEYVSPPTLPLEREPSAQELVKDAAPEPDVAFIAKLTGVHKWFTDARTGKRVDVLKNFYLEVKKKGEFLVLLGPSGCGKSTVLSMISGLQLADAGLVEVYDKPVTGPTPEAATVPQAYTCFPWMNVVKNVEFGLDIMGVPARERRETAMEYLKKVGLDHRAEAYPKQLSGGQQQRVAIARTLAMKLPIVLMDEPFGALDALTRAKMQQLLLKLWDDEKNNIIFVTHDITEALLLGDRVIVFTPCPVGPEYFVRDNLDDQLGHDRPPTLVREERFLKLYEELLGELQREPYVSSATEQPEDGTK